QASRPRGGGGARGRRLVRRHQQQGQPERPPPPRPRGAALQERRPVLPQARVEAGALPQRGGAAGGPGEDPPRRGRDGEAAVTPRRRKTEGSCASRHLSSRGLAGEPLCPDASTCAPRRPAARATPPFTKRPVKSVSDR